MTSRETQAETLRNFSDAQFKFDGFNRQRQEEFARRFLKDDKDIQEFFCVLTAAQPKWTSTNSPSSLNVVLGLDENNTRSTTKGTSRHLRPVC